jgi:hypothetical protein
LFLNLEAKWASFINALLSRIAGKLEKILLRVNRTFTSDTKLTVNAERQYDFLRPSNPVSFIVKYD